jgi:hypothetical protein
MRSIWATRPIPPDPSQIHPALNSFAGERRGMLVHLAIYLGVLALLAMIGAHLWGELPDSVGLEPAAKGGWSLATRSYPAFAVSQFDLYGKIETYEVFRHPVLASSNSLMTRMRGYPAGRAKARTCRPGGPRSAVC